MVYTVANEYYTGGDFTHCNDILDLDEILDADVVYQSNGTYIICTRRKKLKWLMEIYFTRQISESVSFVMTGPHVWLETNILTYVHYTLPIKIHISYWQINCSKNISSFTKVLWKMSKKISTVFRYTIFDFSMI